MAGWAFTIGLDVHQAEVVVCDVEELKRGVGVRAISHGINVEELHPSTAGKREYAVVVVELREGNFAHRRSLAASYGHDPLDLGIVDREPFGRDKSMADDSSVCRVEQTVRRYLDSQGIVSTEHKMTGATAGRASLRSSIKFRKYA